MTKFEIQAEPVRTMYSKKILQTNSHATIWRTLLGMPITFYDMRYPFVKFNNLVKHRLLGTLFNYNRYDKITVKLLVLINYCMV